MQHSGFVIPLMSRFLLAGLVCLAACDKGEPGEPAAAAASPAGEAGVAKAPAGPVAEAGAAEVGAAEAGAAEVGAAEAGGGEPTPEAIPPETPPAPSDPSFAVAIAALTQGETPSESSKQSAWTHYKAAEYAEAQKHFALVAQLEPDNWKHPFNLACAASLAKDEDMTRIALREAFKRDPGTVEGKAASEGDLAVYRSEGWFQELLGIEPLDEFDADLSPENQALVREIDALDRNEEDPPDAPVLTISPVATTVSWREVGRPTESLSMVNLAGGVVAKGASGYYDIDDAGQLVLRAEIEAPAAEPFGIWPDNTWYIERREKRKERGDTSGETTYELRLMRLRSKRRWVPQEYLGEQRWDDAGEQIRLGGKGGLLVLAPDAQGQPDYFFSRIAGGAEDPYSNTYMGELVDWMETKSGRIYTISRYKAGLVATRNCEDKDCAILNMAELPGGSDWSFSHTRTRKRHAMSLIATQGGSKHYLLHAESGGWKLNPTPSAPRGLWATKDGGLWVQIGEALWHRDPSGSWRDVALPAGASGLSAGMRADQSELWIAVSVGGKSLVFATAANAQDPTPS